MHTMLSKPLFIAMLMAACFQCITSDTYYAQYAVKKHDACLKLEPVKVDNDLVRHTFTWGRKGKEGSKVVFMKSTKVRQEFNEVDSETKELTGRIVKLKIRKSVITESFLDKNGNTENEICFTIEKIPTGSLKKAVEEDCAKKLKNVVDQSNC